MILRPEIEGAHDGSSGRGNIEQQEYHVQQLILIVDFTTPADTYFMAISIKTPEQIEKMRVAGRLAAEILESKVSRKIGPVNLNNLPLSPLGARNSLYMSIDLLST